MTIDDITSRMLWEAFHERATFNCVVEDLDMLQPLLCM